MTLGTERGGNGASCGRSSFAPDPSLLRPVDAPWVKPFLPSPAQHPDYQGPWVKGSFLGSSGCHPHLPWPPAHRSLKVTSQLTPPTPPEVMVSPPLADEPTDGQRGEGPACVRAAGLPDPGNHSLGTPNRMYKPAPGALPGHRTPPHPQAADPPSGRGSIRPQHLPHPFPHPTPRTSQVLPLSPQRASPPQLRTCVTSLLLGLPASGVSPDPAPLHGSNPGVSPLHDLAGSLLSIKAEPSNLPGVGGSPHRQEGSQAERC